MADEFDEEPGSESSSGIGHKPIRRGWNMNEGTKLLSEKKNVINRKVGSLRLLLKVKEIFLRKRPSKLLYLVLGILCLNQ